jgi:hypothetical protein
MVKEMRQNNDMPRTARLRQAVEDTLSDYGQMVRIFRAHSPVGQTTGVVEAAPYSRIHITDLAVYRFLYRIYLQVSADVRTDDVLLANGVYFLVRDVDLGISDRVVATCLCERLASGP